MAFDHFLLNKSFLFLLLLINIIPSSSGEGLKFGFYNATCPQAEDLVLAEMRAIVREDRTLAPALLRFQLHDCFVRGCDGSIMMNSMNGTAEKDAEPNLTLRGFDSIERIKAKLEMACPLTVSCADIIVIAARDAVYLSNGPRYPVETGRRDGNVSIDEDALNDLPPPDSNIVDLKTFFSVKDLDSHDLVVLIGAHTIGVAHCDSFDSRLYNYSGKMDQDPSLNTTYAVELEHYCKPDDNTTLVQMDPSSPFTFDLGYYKNVYRHRGLFTSDEALMNDELTKDYVGKQVNATLTAGFFKDFGNSMINMGRIDVLTDANGEIRNVCGVYVQ